MKKTEQGQGQRSFVGENILAYSATKALNRYRAMRKKLCWKCQKDKSTRGGYVKAQAGLFKFICKDCMDAKKLKETKID